MATTNQENMQETTKLESMVTPEQVLSASVARRRRIQTKKSSQNRNRTREKTPIREIVPEAPPSRPTRRRSLKHSDSDEKPSEEVIKLLDIAKRSLSSDRARKPTIERKAIIKRSQSTPRELTVEDSDLIESFKKAQRLSAEVGTSKIEYSSSHESIITDLSSTSEEEHRKQDLIQEKQELQKKLNLIKREKVENQEKWKKSSETIPKLPTPQKVEERKLFRNFVKEAWQNWKLYIIENEIDYKIIISLRNRCLSHSVIMFIFCGLGGMMFRFTEGAFENFYKCGVKRVKRDFIDSLWYSSHNLREEDWKSLARRKLMDFEEQLHEANEAGVHSYSGQKAWSFMNAIVYCITVITTIGYGHITPSTTTGRVATIAYAIFGIPIFMILLTDFSKLLTRTIKFWWGFVRRLYYTTSYRKVQKAEAVQDVMKGVQMVYDIATFRRSSKTEETSPATVPIEISSPSKFTIDDNFNLPMSVAIVILLLYIFSGAVVYWLWEPNWSLFESFYFVFISMSTIGFGDFVPNHPIYMMASLLYLVFGLALTSMCINVVQEKLSYIFRQISAKLSATIGLAIADNDGSLG